MNNSHSCKSKLDLLFFSFAKIIKKSYDQKDEISNPLVFSGTI